MLVESDSRPGVAPLHDPEASSNTPPKKARRAQSPAGSPEMHAQRKAEEMLENGFAALEALKVDSTNEERGNVLLGLLNRPVVVKEADGPREEPGWVIAGISVDTRGRKYVTVAKDPPPESNEHSIYRTVPLDELREWQKPPEKPEQSDETSQEAQDDPRDMENRKTDIELLGKSFLLDRTIQRVGQHSMNSWDKMYAVVRNIPAYPKHAWLALVEGVARASYERKRAKVDKNTSLVWLKEDRDSRAARAGEKHQAKLSKKTDHWKQISGRYNRVATRAKQREADHYELVKSCVDIKAEKIARKAARAQLRETEAGFFERRAYVKNVLGKPENREKLLRAGRHLKEKEIVKRENKRYERKHHRVEKREGKLQEKYRASAEVINDLSRAVEEIDQSLYELQTRLLPSAEVALDVLFKRHLRATVNDDIAGINAGMREAKNTIQELEERAETLLARKEALLEEITEAKQERTELAGHYSRAQVITATSSDRLSERRRTASEAHDRSQRALGEMLNINHSKEHEL